MAPHLVYPQGTPILTSQITANVEAQGAERGGSYKSNGLVPKGILKCLTVITPAGVKPKVTTSKD